MRDRKPCGARALHAIFSDIYGTAALYVTADRVHFKPPQHTAYPAWADPGDVHYGLHWDVDTRRASWPVPYSVQGVVYLEDTYADQGALRVVKGFHTRLASWDATQPANRSTLRPSAAAAAELLEQATPIAARAGSLVLWPRARTYPDLTHLELTTALPRLPCHACPALPALHRCSGTRRSRMGRCPTWATRRASPRT